MDLPIADSRFARQKLVLRTASLFAPSRLLVDGIVADRHGTTYTLTDDDGQRLRARLITHPVDPIPRVEVGEHVHRLVPALVWYEYVWMALPIGLLLIGGTVGAFFGFLAAYINTRVFRLPYPAPIRYLLTGTVSLAAATAMALIFVGMEALLA